MKIVVSILIILNLTIYKKLYDIYYGDYMLTQELQFVRGSDFANPEWTMQNNYNKI